MPTPLPIDAALPDLLAALRTSPAVVLVAPPGAGKTTRVPPAILAGGLLSREYPNIVMLQPRRVAARAAAARIAQEQGWSLGGQVGYHVRFDRRIGRDTRIRVVTEGILTRQLADDPELAGVGCVLLDEFHERSIHSDLAIALLREVQQSLRPDLKIVVMSATLAAETVAGFLGNAPIVRSEGRLYPIELQYRSVPIGESVDAIPSALEELLSPRASANDPGDLLIFLPGMSEIRRTQSALQSLPAAADCLILPLHGSLPPDQQDAALRPADRRKIILATNIAETSLTIDGVATVIDTGLARQASYDAERGLDRLDLVRISRASSDQRAGRAGRQRPGRCIRLWSEKEQHALQPFDEPEIRRVDLAATVLQLHAWGVSPRSFGWFERPGDEAIDTADSLLAMLGALDAGRLTPLGQQLASLPMHPRLARLLVAASAADRLQDGAMIAALLSEKDIVAFTGDRRANTTGDSDVLDRIRRLHAHDRSLDPIAVRAVHSARDQFLQAAGSLEHSVVPGSAGGSRSRAGTHPVDRIRPPGKAAGYEDEDSDAVLLRCILLAYPDRVCRRRSSDPTTAAMVGGGGVRVGDESIVTRAPMFVALDARHDDRPGQRRWNPVASTAVVRMASAIEPAWLEELFPQAIVRESIATFDEPRSRVIGRRVTRYRDLILDEAEGGTITAEQAVAALVEWASPRAMQLLRQDEFRQQWLNRLALLARVMPDRAWPAVDEALAREAMAQAAIGSRSLEDLSRGLTGALEVLLPYPLDRAFEAEAPQAIDVPTGNRIKLDYPEQPSTGETRPPVLAVRLQEVFGLRDTPRIAAGRVRVLLHLLGPNYRPVQVTDDLQSFWAGTYFQVRKDLRVRYPKHAWPEDPLTAPPVARGRPRK